MCVGEKSEDDPRPVFLFLFLFVAPGIRGVRFRTEIDLGGDEFAFLIRFYVTADFLAHDRIIERGGFARFIKLSL